MRSKLALFISLVALAALAAALPATASASYSSVYVTPSTDGYCTPAPGQLSYYLTFKAKVKTIGIAKPKKVRIGYQVLDADTQKVLRSGVVNLKKSSGYKAKGAPFTVVADQKLTYHLNMKYKIGRRTLKSKKSYDDYVPSAEALANSGLPAC